MLYFVTAVSNPFKSHGIYALYEKFRHYMVDELHFNLMTVEISYDGEYVVTERDKGEGEIFIQVRGENIYDHVPDMLRIGVAALPKECEYYVLTDNNIYVKGLNQQSIVSSLQANNYCVLTDKAMCFAQRVNHNPNLNNVEYLDLETVIGMPSFKPYHGYYRAIGKFIKNIYRDESDILKCDDEDMNEEIKSYFRDFTPQLLWVSPFPKTEAEESMNFDEIACKYVREIKVGGEIHTEHFTAADDLQ